MSYTLSIEKRPDYLYFLVTGENSADTVSQYMARILQECRQRDCFRVLVHERLSGPRLSPMEVFSIASQGSMDILGVFEAIAYVDEDTGEMLEFAETVAVNRGTPAATFTKLAEAEKWIVAQDAGDEASYAFVPKRQI